ncbi:MAG TPA: GAF domain-containing protein [Anaerolineales bacterium]
MNILVSSGIGLTIIAIAVGLVGDNPLVIWVLSISVIINIIGIILALRGITLPGRILLPTILSVAAGYIAYNRGGLYHISMLGFPVIVVLAGLLLGTLGSFFYATVASVAAAILGYTDINGISPFSASSRTGYDDIAVATTMFFLTAVVLRVIINRLTESIQEAEEYGKNQEASNIELIKLQGELEQRVDERTRKLRTQTDQLEAIANVARSVATIQSTKQLLPAITRLVSERFFFYHVGIFLLDSNQEFAVLSAANSPGGQNMLARGHRLKVGEQGIVGYATQSGKPRIALDVGDDAVYFNNPELPETHSEVALPLKFGNTVIGALDIQSTETNAFSQDNLEIFSILADQVSIAIQNARSLEQAQRALQGMESVSRQSVGQAWRDYAKTISTKGYRYDGIKPEPLKGSPKSLKGALSVPIQLRGETIGNLKLRAAEQSREWTVDELAIIESTAERVAIALENARLLDDAQKRASRETFLSGMAAKLGTSFQLDSILRDTVEELGQTLKGSTVTFQLVNPSALAKLENDNANGAGRKKLE